MNSDWWHTATLLALIENALKKKGAKPTKPIERHPNGARLKPKARPPTKEDMERLFGRKLP